MFSLNYKPEINLFEELEGFISENTLKNKLQKDISYMSNKIEMEKSMRLKIFKDIQILLKNNKLNELFDYYVKKINENNKNLIKNFDGKIHYEKKPNINNELLENSKDRLTFLNDIVTSQASGYNPIKNYMENFRVKSKIISEKRRKEREQKLRFLKARQLRLEKNNLQPTAERLNRARIEREKAKQERIKRKQEKKKNFNPEKTTEIISIDNFDIKKSDQDERIDNIILKTGDINGDKKLVEAGFYELPEYEKALIFKFDINFNNEIRNKVFDLIDKDGDLLMHLNIREDKLIIINSQIDNKWGKEVRLKQEFKEIKTFKILIRNDYYKVMENDNVITFFIQRKKSKSKFFSLNDNINNFVFKTM